ncbi:MAG: phosphodiester glycosidase family protein [Oscillospiraceae bacterium]|nr:phosphodiester glycosidase family protein [Oscillospiraceae bacterium]
MKLLFRRSLSFLLAFVLAAAPLAASASDALGDDLAEKTTAVHSAAQLSKSVLWSNTYSDFRTENYVVYTPSEAVTPIVTNGGYATARTTVRAAAAKLEEQGLRVVAGINGDYYGVSNGVPLGIVVTEGVIRNASGENYAIGFRADGTSVFGAPQLSITAAREVTAEDGTTQTAAFPIAAINHVRYTYGGIYLYTNEFNSLQTTGATETGVDVVCTVTDGALTIGGTVTLRVESVSSEASGTKIEPGQVVLTANLKAGETFTAPLLALAPGDTLTVSTTAASEAWNDVSYAIGALYSLVENGAVAADIPKDTAAPRTAIGQKADGSLVLYTIDGRKAGHSIGATLPQVAERLIELGCVTALSLDGGGSTTMLATMPDATSASVINTPSDGSERAVTNHIFLVADAAPSGVADHIYLASDYETALPGAGVYVNASVVDTKFIPLGVAPQLASDKGTVSGNTVTMPVQTGTVQIGAKYGKMYEIVRVEVVDKVDEIALYNGANRISSVHVAPNSELDLTARGIIKRLPVAGDDTCFTWTLSGDVGTIDKNGVFKASADVGVGSLTVSVGASSVTVPVTVSARPLTLLESFEDALGRFTASDTASITQEISTANARFGYRAGKVDYKPLEDGIAALGAAIPVPAGYDRVTLWARAANDGATLALVTDSGATLPLALTANAWVQLSFPLPAGSSSITQLLLTDTAAGTLWLDQMVAAYGTLHDTAAPKVAIHSAGAGYVSATAFDGVDGGTLASLSVTLDGKAVPFDYNGTTGAVYAVWDDVSSVTLHRVSVTACDASGNIGRASVDLPAAQGESLFADTAEHWAGTYADHLASRGIVTGYDDGTFLPDRSISRQEFAVMLYRYLAPTEDFSAVTLPFADAASVDAWALEAVRAMYALGVMQGSRDLTGALVCSPKSSISRAEAVTMIGRLQQKGFAAIDFTFTDAQDIPDWSAEYVVTLAARGVLTGYEDGSFQPSASVTRGQMAKILYTLQ